MASFGVSSKGRLLTCSLALQALFNRVVYKYDCSIMEGHRDEETQNKYFDQKKSKVRWPDGKHNTKPSSAVDAGPYIHGTGIPWPQVPDDWNDKPARDLYVKQMMQFAHFGGYVQGTAEVMDIPIRWGGDWDKDNDLRDNKFDDLVHFELVEVPHE